MSRKNLHLVRHQLDETLELFDPVFDLAPPSKGWIRTIRHALGMSGRQLAERLGLSKQSVARMEQDELAAFAAETPRHDRLTPGGGEKTGFARQEAPR